MRNLKKFIFVMLVGISMVIVGSSFRVNETVPVISCFYTSWPDDHCYASGGGQNYDISGCIYRPTDESTCGINIPPALN